jgi:pimeloyl-ACP methyl ester carboxylesterase
MRRHLLTLAAVTGLIAALAPAPASYAGPAVDASPPGLSWGACPPSLTGVARDPRQKCTTVPVPLDYRDPGGRTISIEVSRIPTAKPQSRRGVLLFNPGGPGGSGLDFPTQLLPLLPPAVTDRFDLIGFDPRGIGYSAPVTCGLATNVAADLVLPYPAPDGSITRNISFGRDTAQSCARLSGDLLPFITTANTARDMDRIRAALGETKLSYIGYSYGTYLGAVYTTLFPRHSDRILLDSAVDPDLVWYRMWRTWGPAIALRLPDFTTWAAAHDATYHLGATPSAVRRTYDDLTARFDRNPLTLPTGSAINGNVVRELTRSLLYSDAAFPLLADDWQYLAGQPATGAPRQTPPDLYRALHHLVPGAQASPQVPADNSIAALYSVVCDDAAWPRNTSIYARNVARGRLIFPATAGMPDNLWPCAFWPSRPIEPPVTVTDRGPRNVLILQNLRDPATPWLSGFGLRQALGARAGFVSVDQGGHGVYLFTAAPCAADTATTFLTTGTLPDHDRLCPGQSPPALGTLSVPPQLPGPLG